MNAASATLSSAQNGDNTSPPEWPDGIPIPESFICPLSRRLMVHPVIDKEGNSYERDAIKIYLTATEGMSPTNQPLNMSDLIENRGLKMAIEVALQSAHEQKKIKSRGPVLKRFSLARRRSSLSRESSGRSNQSTLHRQDLPSRESEHSLQNSMSRKSSKSKMSDSTRGDKEEQNKPTRRLLKKNESFKIRRNNDDTKGRKDNIFASFTTGFTKALQGKADGERKANGQDAEEKPSLIVVTHEEIKFDEPFDVSTNFISDTNNYRRASRRSPNVSRSSSRSSIVSEEDLQKSLEEQPELAMLEHQDIKFMRRLSDPDNGEAASPTSYRRKISKSHSPKRSTPNRDEFDSESGSEDELDLAMSEHHGIKFATLPEFDLKSSLRSSTSSLGDLIDVAQLAENEERTNHDFSISDPNFADLKKEEVVLSRRKALLSQEKASSMVNVTRKPIASSSKEQGRASSLSTANFNAFKTNLEELRKTIPAQQSRKKSSEPVDMSNRTALKSAASKESKDSSKTATSSSTLRTSNSKRTSSSRLSIRQSANPDDFKAFEKGLAELRGLASALRQDSMKREKTDCESNAGDTRSSTADLSCSWGDLSGDIARAQTMSLTVSKNDAKQIESKLEASLETDDRQVSTDGSKEKRRKSRRDKSDKSSERRRSSNKSAERKSSRRSKSSQTRDKDVNKTEEPKPEHKHRTSKRRGDVKIDAQVVPSYQPQRSGRRRRSRSNKRVQAVEE